MPVQFSWSVSNDYPDFKLADFDGQLGGDKNTILFKRPVNIQPARRLISSFVAPQQAYVHNAEPEFNNPNHLGVILEAMITTQSARPGDLLIAQKLTVTRSNIAEFEVKFGTKDYGTFRDFETANIVWGGISIGGHTFKQRRMRMTSWGIAGMDIRLEYLPPE